MEGMYTMRKLTLTNHAQSNTTVLENEFIDNYMAKANGEYVKVYLLLLRHLTEPSGTLTVSRIADLLEITEKDVVRALNYWKKQGLLEYESAPESGPASSSLPSDVPDIRQYRSRKEFKELLFVAEQYLGKTLSATDIEAITYFYETLHMSADLIEYLIEYCVENGHKSIHYIQKVALSWHEQEFHTVEEAKAGTQAYNRNCYSVLNAYGIKGRSPATSEIAYIRKWNEEYGFALEIILEACARTMNKIHQPSFEYTDSILKSWLAQNLGVAPEKICCISIMPCVAKKAEAELPTMATPAGPDVDYVLTTRELVRMIRADQLDPALLPEEEMDSPMGTFTGAAAIFGTTGGVMEAALRTAAYTLTGSNPDPDAFQAVRTQPGLRELTCELAGATIRCAVVSGLRNTRQLIEAIKAKRVHYDFVEVMACPGGCVGGGGQPISVEDEELACVRGEELYALDQKNPLRFSHENPVVQTLYREYLGRPLSPKAEALLHTDHSAWSMPNIQK